MMATDERWTMDDLVLNGVAGLLLTGGASSRMGCDKASIEFDGVRLVDHLSALLLSALLASVTSPVFEVGPGYSLLKASVEEPVGTGPLAAVAAGALALERSGHTGGAIVLACDLPLFNSRVLNLLIHWPGAGSVLPVVAGHAQPLCARWSLTDLTAAHITLARGENSLRTLPNRTGATLLDESAWGPVTNGEAFADIDTPDDLRQARQLLTDRRYRV